MKVEFETFKNLIGDYERFNMEKKEPSAINFLSYRKFKVTIEAVEESNEVLIQRLENLMVGNTNMHQLSMIKNEIKRLTN